MTWNGGSQNPSVLAQCVQEISAFLWYHNSRVLCNSSKVLCTGSTASQLGEIFGDATANQRSRFTLQDLPGSVPLIGCWPDQQCRFEFSCSQWGFPLLFALPRSTLPLLIMAKYLSRGFASEISSVLLPLLIPGTWPDDFWRWSFMWITLCLILSLGHLVLSTLVSPTLDFFQPYLARQCQLLVWQIVWVRHRMGRRPPLAILGGWLTLSCQQVMKSAIVTCHI